MPFSSGTFSLNATYNPVVTGTTIQSAWANTTLTDIAANGLSYCVLKDGTQTITADLPMSGFKFTGLGAGAARTDSIRVGQVQDSTTLFLGTVAGTNTVTAVLTPSITAYARGQQFLLTPAATNTGASTLNINGVGAGAIQQGGAALTGGELTQGVPAILAVVTTTPVFEIVGNGANVNGGKTRTANTVLAGPTSGSAISPAFRYLVAADIPSLITLGTPQATTSGTSKDFTGIPATAKRVTAMFSAVSTNGTNDLLLQLGVSGGPITTGYVGGAGDRSGESASTSGAVVSVTTGAGTSFSGSIVFTFENSSSNVWAWQGVLFDSSTGTPAFSAGKVPLSGLLTQIRFTSVGTSDTFDAGEANIAYE